MSEDFEIYIDDVGDPSVGLQPETTLKAVLHENMVEHLKENNLLRDFENRLKALVDEFYEAEIHYEITDSEMLKQEENDLM